MAATACADMLGDDGKETKMEDDTGSVVITRENLVGGDVVVTVGTTGLAVPTREIRAENVFGCQVLVNHADGLRGDSVTLVSEVWVSMVKHSV